MHGHLPNPPEEAKDGGGFVKLDLPVGVELLGYEPCSDGHGFEVKFPLPDWNVWLRPVRVGHLRVQEHRLCRAPPGPVEQVRAFSLNFSRLLGSFLR